MSLGVVLGPGSQASQFIRRLSHLSANLFRCFFVFALGCYLRWFARRLGPSDAPLFRYFRLLLVAPFREHDQVLPNGSDLSRRLLPLMSKDVEIFAGGREFRLDLGEIPDCRLLLVPLGQQLILGSL